MKINEILIVFGTAHQKSILGKSSPDGKFKEYAYSREVCKALKDIFVNMGYNAVIDVEEDDLRLPQSKELQYRCNIVNNLAKKYKHCIYVSIHVNGIGCDGKWHDATGWEIYTSPGKTDADKLATCIYEAAKVNLKSAKKVRTDFSDGDADKEANFYVLKHTNCPAVLTENLFQDNKSDVEYLTSDEGFHAITRLHIEGILNYIKNN